MFVALAKKYNTSNALNEVFESRAKGIDRTDYLAVATVYLQVFNPSKATPEKVQAMLAKYKGKEEAMFASLSSKWFTTNPLEKPKPAEPATSSAQETKPQNIFGQSSDTKAGTSAPTPSPFAGFSAQKPFAAAAAAAPPAPVATETKSSGTSAPEKNYHKVLTEFYQKHNPKKVSEVAKTLEKYKVRII